MAKLFKPIKTVKLAKEATYGVKPTTGNFYSVELEDTSLPVLSHDMIDVSPVRSTLINSKHKVVGVQTGAGPEMKIACDGLFNSDADAVTEVDDGAGNVLSSVLEDIKSHHRILPIISHGRGGELNGPEAVTATNRTYLGRMNGAGTVTVVTTAGGIVTKVAVNTTTYIEDRFSIGSVLFVEQGTSKWLLGVTDITTSGSTLTMAVVGGPASGSLTSGATIYPAHSMPMPLGGDTLSVACEMVDYGNSDGTYSDGDYWSVYGLNGSTKITGNPQEVCYQTYTTNLGNWEIDSTAQITGLTAVALSPVDYHVVDDETLYVNKLGVQALSTDFPSSIFEVDFGVERTEQKSVESANGRIGRPVVKLNPTISIDSYWNRTIMDEFATMPEYSIAYINGNGTDGGFGIFSWCANLMEAPAPQDTDGLLGQKMMFQPIANPTAVDANGNLIKERLSPLVLVRF